MNFPSNQFWDGWDLQQQRDVTCISTDGTAYLHKYVYIYTIIYIYKIIYIYI